MSTSIPPTRSYFLELPTELRLAIYDVAISDSKSITITSAAVEGSSGHEKEKPPRTDILGLPPNHVPFVRGCYEPSLLSITCPVTVPDDHQYSTWLPHPPSLALLQTNKQVNNELSSYMRLRKTNLDRSGGISVYVTYPYGVIILKALYPTLLRQVRCIYICGYYNLKVPATTDQRSSASLAETISDSSQSSLNTSGSCQHRRIRGIFPYSYNTSLSPTIVPYAPLTTATASATLTNLTRTLLSPTPSSAPLFQKLETRIFYPDESTYSSVWGNDQSPIVEVLRNICGGKIDMEVWRGRRGTGVKLRCEPSPNARVISTIWRRLGDRREEAEGWVLGGEWPEE